MTFSQRCRFIRLLWALVSNSFLPFILGSVFSLVLVTHAVTDSFLSFDKAGLDVCRKIEVGQGGNL